MDANQSAQGAIAASLNQVLGEVPFLRLGSTIQEPGELDSGIDIAVDVTANGTPWKLLVEVKSSGEPRIARAAIQQILAVTRTQEPQYGLLGAPYVSPETQKICKEAGVGFIDLAGNCRLVFDKVYIERRGFPKPKAERRPLRSLFFPKRSEE